MIPIPKGTPALGALNTFYLDLERLIAHYQGEIGAGCVHLRSPQITAAVYFDREEIAETCVQAPEGTTYGAPAFTKLLGEIGLRTFTVDVFELDPARVHFWASLARFETLYTDLSAEFTDLRGLIRKMGTQKLTGFIHVAVLGEAGGGLLLFDEGQVAEESYGLETGPRDGPASLEALVKACTDRGGTFTVCRALVPERPADAALPSGDGEELVHAAEQALQALEAVVQAQRNRFKPFSTLLRAKFLMKAGEHEFLDPFAGELGYVNGEIEYDGEAELRTVALALAECVSEIAQELGLLSALQERLREDFSGRPEDLITLGLAA